MAEELLVNIVGDTSKLKGALDKASGSITSFATKAAAAGKGMAIAGGLITAAFGLTVKSAISFNEEIANIATLIPGSTKRVNELKSAIRTMAVEVGKDTKDLAQGAYQVISAFGDTADTVAILGIAAKAATAGVATTTDAIDLLSAVTKGYGDTSKEAVQKVSDLAFQTVTLGQTTFPELANSIGKVTPLAASLGLEAEELFAVMATGTGVTGGAAEVATQLRGVFQSLMAPTADMIKLLEDKEYASGKAMLADLGLAEALDMIVKEAEKTGLPLQKFISSIEGQTLALALTGAQSDTYREKLDAMGEAQGLSDLAFKEQTEGINEAGFAFKQAKIQITVLAQEIGDMLLPRLTPLIDKATEIVGKVREWAEVNKPLVETIVKWAAGLGVALAFLGPILIMLPGLIVALGLLKLAFIPFLVGGIIIIGIAALAKTFKELKETIYLTAEEAKKMTLADLNKSIEKVMKSVDELETVIEAAEFGEAKGKIAAITINRWKKELEELNSTLDMLCVIRQELTDAEKEGADVTEELTEIDKAMADQQEKINELLKDYAKGLKDLPKEIEEVEKVTKMLEDRILELTDPIAYQIKVLYELATKWQEAGVDMDLVAEYVELATEAIYKQNEAIDENIGLLEDIAKVTEDVKDAIYELTAEPYEVVLKGISEKYEDLIERVKESTLTTKEKEDAIAELTINMEKEIELVDKTTEAEGEAIEAAKLLADTTKLVTDEILEMTDPLAYNIQQIDELAETWRLAGVDAELIAEAVRLLKEALTPPDVDPWEDFWDSLKDDCLTTTEILIEGFKQFWSDFKNALTDAVTSLLTMAETNAQILEDMAEAEADYIDTVTELQEELAETIEEINEDIVKGKEDYYDDLAALELDYNRKISDGLKDMARENEDYDIEMRRLKEEYNKAVMEGDDERAEHFKEKMEDCTLDHKRAVEDMEEKQTELVEDNEIKLAEMEENHKEAMDAMIKKKEEETQKAKDELEEVKEKHKELMEGMEDEMVTTGSIIEDFWKAFKKAAIDALISVIVKQVIAAFVSFCAAIPFGWLVLIAGIAAAIAYANSIAGKALGGGVEALSIEAKALGGGVEDIGKSLGGMVKMTTGGIAKFAAGGMGTDTVPAMLTPGEYVISKPMVDFIKRTGAVTSDLVSAIGSGARTPIPAFTTGGGVGSPISSTYNQQRSYAVNIQPGAIQIVTPKFSEADGQEMFRIIERQAKMRGLKLVRE